VVQSVTDTTGKEVSAAEIYALFRRTYVDLATPYRYLDHQLRNDGKDVILDVQLEIEGARKQFNGRGNGPIDAVVDALDLDLRVMDYHEHALGRGAQAEAAAYVELRRGHGAALYGAGMDVNLIAASLKAVVSAVNHSFALERQAAAEAPAAE
jgi:2-isopropylmalate synthase